MPTFGVVIIIGLRIRSISFALAGPRVVGAVVEVVLGPVAVRVVNRRGSRRVENSCRVGSICRRAACRQVVLSVLLHCIRLIHVVG